MSFNLISELDCGNVGYPIMAEQNYIAKLGWSSICSDRSPKPHSVEMITRSLNLGTRRVLNCDVSEVTKLMYVTQSYKAMGNANLMENGS